MSITFSLDDKFTADHGSVLMSGVQALVRVPIDQRRADMAAGLNTAGFVSGYRGSPLAGLDLIFQRNARLLKQHNILFRPAVNEDLAATMIWGSQIAHFFPQPKHDGVIGMWYGKAPGVDRSGDIFRHANLGGVGRLSGVLVAAGDDPLSKSSTLPSRSDMALADANMPVLAPATVQDVLDFGRYGYALSRFCGLWVGFKIDTHVADEFATAQVDADRLKIMPPLFEHRGRTWQATVTNTIGAPGSINMEQETHEARLPAALAFVRAHPINRITVNPGKAWLGIVAAGKMYFEVKQALSNLGLDDAALHENGIRLLKLGLVWPLDAEIVRSFAHGLEEIMVVEDKRAFIESAIRDVLYALAERPRVIGKFDPQGRPLVPGHGLPDAPTLMPLLAGRLAAKLGAARFAPALHELRTAQLPALISLSSNSAQRGAYFCSGCPHNRSTLLPAGALAGAGIGCHGLIYAMGRTDHLGLGHMGGEGAQWVGAAPFSNTPHLFQNIGDGTFFHSGSLAIRQAVASGENITYKILYNAAVGMTGGQEVDGTISVPALTRLLQAEGVRKIIVTSDDPDKYAEVSGDPFAVGVRVLHRDELEAAQIELQQQTGTSVLIHDQMCAAEKRRRRKRGTLATPTRRIFINERVCEGCGDCGVKSNCLSVHPVETEFGRKTRIHQSSCNLDYSCINGDCPAFVSVDSIAVNDDSPTPRPLPTLGDDLPVPRRVHKSLTSIYMMGIGGTGVVTTNQILGTAAMLEGKHVDGMDQTGLSQKGGAVVSHLKISEAPIDGANLVYAGEADAYLAFDLLTATRPADLLRASPLRTRSVVSTSEVPTGGMVRNVDVQFPNQQPLLAAIDARSIANDNVYLDAQALADEYFGDHMAANLIVVGAAYQAGLLPLQAGSIEHAIKLNGVQAEMNIQAFRLGRHSAAKSEQLAAPQSVPSRTTAELIEARATELTAYQSSAYAKIYRAFVDRVDAAERGVSTDGALTDAVARMLFKLMAYKDEYEVARLYVAPEFEQALSAQFGPGAKPVYHLHPPFLRALGMKQKLKLGPWFKPMFGLLAAGKHLRGTALDVFGLTRHRREERALIVEYKQLIERVLASLSAQTLAQAVSLAESPDMIRGYEDVKSKNVRAWRAHVGG